MDRTGHEVAARSADGARSPVGSSDAGRMPVGAGTMVDMAGTGPVDPTRGPMVGRSRELDVLRERFAVAAGGDPQVVVIAGEAGIGKSRLVAEFAGSLGSSARVLVGHCLELGPDGPPFAPFVMMLRSLAADVGLERLAEMTGPGRTDLAGLAPELGPVVREDTMGRGRLFEAITTLLERAAGERALVVVVEDLHWSDASTRDLLRFLMRTIGSARVLLLLTYRRDEMHRSHPLLPWLTEVDRLPHCHRMTLDRLTDEQVDALVRSIAGDVGPRSAARIRQRSEGIPFFVEELATCAERDTAMPETLRDLMLTRLDRLSPRTREVLRIASAAGTKVDHPVLQAVVDADEIEFEQSLREAVGGQVLVVDRARESYAFRHALMREAVHADLLPGEHARLHARYARALEHLARPEQAGEIAHHWGSAHEVDHAFEWSLRAAEHSRSVYAWREQLAHLERALDLWDRVGEPAQRAGFDRVELLSRTSHAASNAGLADRGLALLDMALAEVDPVTSPERTAHLLVKRAHQCEGARRDPTGDLDRALSLAPPGSVDRAAALGVRAGILMVEGRMEQALAAALEARAAAEQCADARQLSSAHNVLGCVLFQLGRGAEGQAHLDRARDVAIGSGSHKDLFRYYGNYSDVLIGAGRFADAIAMARTGRTACAEQGLSRTMGAFLAGNEAEACVLAGLWDEAMTTIDEALRLDPPPVTRGHLHELRALVQVRRGDIAGAADSTDRAAEHLVSATRQPQHMLPLAVARAELAVADGDMGRALGLLADAAAAAGPLVPTASGWPFAWAWGRALLDAGQPEPAELARIREHLGQASPHPGWTALTSAQAARGGIPADWAGAVTACAGTEGLAYEVAEARIRLAQQLLAAGRRDDARQELDQAWATIERLGAQSLAAPAARAAARGGIPVPRGDRRAGAVESLLTPREAEVLRLVCAGRSNRAIAEELFISIKTASVHVSNILAKVGASSRTEAAAWAHAHGLLDAGSASPGGAPGARGAGGGDPVGRGVRSAR